MKPLFLVNVVGFINYHTCLTRWESERELHLWIPIYRHSEYWALVPQATCTYHTCTHRTPEILSLRHIASEPNWTATAVVLGQYRERLVHFAHAARATIHKAFPGLFNVAGLGRGNARNLAEGLCALADAHELEEVGLRDRAVDLDAVASEGGGLCDGVEVDVGAEVDEPRGGKGADEAVLADAAEGVYGHDVGGAVVEDEGGAAGGGFGVGAGAADAGGEVGGVEGGVGADFDDGAGGLFEAAVAGGGFGEDAGVSGGGGGEDELELGGRLVLLGLWGAEVCVGCAGGCDGYHHLAPLHGWRCGIGGW